MIGGCSVWLDGVNDFVSLGTVAARNFVTTNFSGMAWIYTTNAAVAQSHIFSHGVSGASGYALNLNNAGALNFRTSSPGNILTTSQSGVIVANTWFHVAWSLSGSTCRLYINGDEPPYSAIGAHAAPTSSAAASAVGAVVGGASGWFPGAIDEPAFFNVALTQEQIREYMYSSIPVSTPNCVSLHHFDDGLANFASTSAAATISGVAGTLANGATWVYDRWAPWVEPRVSSTVDVTPAVATEVQITNTLRRFIPRVKTRVSIAAQWDLQVTTAGTGSLRCLIRENGVALPHEVNLIWPAAPLTRGSHPIVATRDWTASTVYTLDMAARLNLAGDTIRAAVKFPHTGYVVVAMPVDGTW